MCSFPLNQSFLFLKYENNNQGRVMQSESEFNEFEPRLKSAKNRFQLSAGTNFETLNKILSGTINF